MSHPKTRAAVAVIGIVFLSGCLYEVGVLDKPARQIDRIFLGSWQWGDRHRLDITAKDNKHYRIVLTYAETNALFPAPLEMEAFHARVGAIELVAAYAKSGPKQYVDRYSFFTYTNEGTNTLILSSLNSDFVSLKTKSQEALISQLTNAASKTNLFLQDILPFKRITESK